MSIFDGQVEKSEAQVRFEQIVAKASSQKQGEENRCLSAFQDLWGGGELIEVGEYRTVVNPISKEVATELLGLIGTDAYKVFQSHSLWQDGIMVINPDWKKLVPPYTVSFNQDGSANVGDSIIPSETPTE